MYFICYLRLPLTSYSQAKSADAIKRKVLERIAALTTHPIFHEDDTSDDADADMIVTSPSDADSSGDGKVTATSVDSEDDVVDITMKDGQTQAESKKVVNTTVEASRSSCEPTRYVANGALIWPPLICLFHDTDMFYSDISARKKQRRPRFVNPKHHLPGEMQNLFQLGYFTEGKSVIPTGWSTVDENRKFPTLSSREPQPEIVDEEESTAQDDAADNETSEEDSEEDARNKLSEDAPTRMNEESSEDELSNAPITLPSRPAGPKNGFKVGSHGQRRRGKKTHSRKGRKKSDERGRRDDSHESEVDEGPVIRLGEGIVVDWDMEAFDVMFNGSVGDTMRGQATWNMIQTLPDPELDAKKRARMQRRNKGITLDDCLDEFGKEEILSEMDTWYCPRCKEHRRASKKFELWKTPDILVMHLKRFSSSTVRRDKLDVLVDFPIDGLDLSSRVVEKQDGKVEIYDLFAVDDHWGGLGGGHYTAFAKSFVDGHWYEYNGEFLKPTVCMETYTNATRFIRLKAT